VAISFWNKASMENSMLEALPKLLGSINTTDTFTPWRLKAVNAGI